MFCSVAQSSTSIICVAGQCLQGFANITLGATLSSQGVPTVHLLPGQYTSTTNPELLHNLLTSSSATLSSSPGFNLSSISPLPLNIVLQPGLAIYSDPSYAGQAAFSQLPSAPIVNTSLPLQANSLALANNVWAAVTSGSASNRIIFWEPIPDVSQLPSEASQSLALIDMQSSACSPPCSGSGVCSASGTCSCPTGFTGSSCETCSEGFFGPTCQPCPSGCESCDQGISGSGLCLVPVVTNAPSTCNCLNGQCGSNGQCTCNPGWTNASNGTACAQCATGFFLTSTGDCQVCELGCSQCADGTATCISCEHGFTQNANDNTKCIQLPAVTSGGTTCPDGSFNAGSQCSPCSPSCSTCNGPSSNNCIVCAAGQSLFNSSCVATSSNGVCEGSNGMIANNNKQECDTCGAKCTACEIPNFSVASIFAQLQCTGCLPGFFLSQGNCVGSCPSGTFLSPQDNLTCTACSSSCGTCLGSADFCLTCSSSQQLTSSGQCVSTCPTGTFTSNGACVKCHPDCANCSGPSFNQCSTCPSNLPVLTSGRCLPTCSSQSQFFDQTSSSCQACDSSCSSCSGSGPNHCLACSSSSEVLRGGTCVSANCDGSSDVVPGLGICLSDLVQVSSSTDSSASSATGLTSPTTVVTNSHHSLAWWQILLMALGCAFIIIVILMLWRRRAKKQRAKQTALFASAKKLDGGNGWRWRLEQFRRRLFGKKGFETEVLPMAYRDDHRQSHTSVRPNRDMKKLRIVEDRSTKRYTDEDLDQFIGNYEDSRNSWATSAISSIDDHYAQHNPRRIERDSLYSEVTGNQRLMPEPRLPLRRDGSKLVKTPVLVDLETQKGKVVPPSLPLQMVHSGSGLPTEAQSYAMSVRPGLVTVIPSSQPPAMPSSITTPIALTPTPPLLSQGSHWVSPVVNTHPIGGRLVNVPPSTDTVVLEPMNTGGSSRNPFRQGAF